MLKDFSIKNYKCYEERMYFDLPGLTVVTGTNNSGKSSFLQSIYLLTQNDSKLYPVITLKDYFGLDTFSKIFNNNASYTENLEIGFTIDDQFLKNNFFEDIVYINFLFKFKSPNEFNELSIFSIEEYPLLEVLEINIIEKENKNHLKSIIFEIVDNSKGYFYKLTIDNKIAGYCTFENLIPSPFIYKEIETLSHDKFSHEIFIISRLLGLLFEEKMHYIKALRVQDYNDRNNSLDDLKIGLSGEYTAEVVNRRWDEKTSFYNKNESILFKDIFTFWIKKLLGENYSIKSEKISNTNYSIKVKDASTGLELALDQVGFGISQILPIITMILSSEPQDIILIENPEVHLHPKLQSIFMDFCVYVANNNRKVLIETHSEHMINNLRLNIKKDSSLLKKTNIYFFENDLNGIITTEIEIDEKGRIEYWPEDFFDQSYYDLLGLITND